MNHRNSLQPGEVNIRPCPRCSGTEYEVRYREEQYRIVRCRSCGLVYLGNPPSTGEIYEEYYQGEDLPPEAYNPDAPDVSLRELYWINRQRIGKILEKRSGGALLDVGCGNGYFLATAGDHGFRCNGIDISSRAIAFATEEMGVEASVKTPDEVRTSGEQYDIVTMWHVLEHFMDPFDVLESAFHLLSPGGLCVVEVPNLRSLKFLVSRNKWEGGNHPRFHRTFFTARTLRESLHNAGFSGVQRIPLTYEFPWRNTAYQLVKRFLNHLGLDSFLFFMAVKGVCDG